MSGEFTIHLSYADYLASNWLRVRARWMWKGMARYIATLGGILFIINFGNDLLSGQASPLSTALDLGVGLFMACIAMLIGWLYLAWCIPRSAKKIYAEQPLLSSPTSYVFSTEGIRINNEREASDLLWSHIQGWIENDAFLLLARTRLTYFPIPKSQVAPETINALRHCLEAADVKQGL